MIKYKTIYLALAIILISTFSTIMSKVDPPNYNFSLDALKIFSPPNELDQIKATHGDGEVIEKKDDLILLKYYVAHLRYKFPVFLQIYKNKSIGFFAKLPSYFLHDIFHQSLINRLGKQNKYFQQENTAIYIWNNNNGLKHVYSGTCTLTCFPVYYAVITLTPPPPDEMGEYKSLLDILQGSEQREK